MTHFFVKIYISLIRVLKSKKKKLVLTFLYCVVQETSLENSKMFNITSKYFSIFNNKPPAS